MPGLPALRGAARQLQSYGRNGDTMLAHITPDEAALLKRRGGAGTRNPVTGLREYWSENNSAEASQGHSNSGAADGNYGGGYSADGMMDMSQPAPAITEERDITTHPSHMSAPPAGAPVNEAMFSIPGFVPGSTAINAMGLAMANPNIRSFDQMMTERQGFNLANAFIGGPIGLIGSLATAGLTSLLGPPERGAETPEESSASANNSVGGSMQQGSSMLPRAMWEQRFLALAGKHPSQATKMEWERALQDPLLARGYGMADGGPVYMNTGGSTEDAIRSYYSSILGREPDAGGMSYYTNAANSGTSLNDIQGMLLNSPEYAARQEAERYYATNYGQAPTAQQMQTALGLNLTGTDLAAALASKASEEEKVRAINNAYQTYFGREAEQDGLNWWLRDWDIVTKDGSILDDILRGAQNSDQGAAVNRLGYQDLFGREAEQAGIDYFTQPDIYKEITAGGLEDLRASMLAGAQGDDKLNAVARSFELMFGRPPAPDELSSWLGKYQDAALQGLRNPIASSAMGDDRQRLVTNADVGMFNPYFTLNKTPGEVFRDYVENKPENALGTSTYYNRANVFDANPQAGWKNPNVAPDDYFQEQARSSKTGVGDMTFGFQGDGGFSKLGFGPDAFQQFQNKTRAGTQTVQGLLNDRFGVDGKAGNFPFANVSVPPLPGSLGPGSLGGTGANRVWAGTGTDPNYIPSYLRDEKGNYRPPGSPTLPAPLPPGAAPGTPPPGYPIDRKDNYGVNPGFPEFGYQPYTPPSVTLNYLQGPIYRYAPDLAPKPTGFIDMDGMAGGGPVRMAFRTPQGLAALR